jgi:hypothetical protein
LDRSAKPPGTRFLRAVVPELCPMRRQTRIGFHETLPTRFLYPTSDRICNIGGETYVMQASRQPLHAVAGGSRRVAKAAFRADPAIRCVSFIAPPLASVSERL